MPSKARRWFRRLLNWAGDFDTLSGFPVIWRRARRIVVWGAAVLSAVWACLQHLPRWSLPIVFIVALGATAWTFHGILLLAGWVRGQRGHGTAFPSRAPLPLPAIDPWKIRAELGKLPPGQREETARRYVGLAAQTTGKMRALRSLERANLVEVTIHVEKGGIIIPVVFAITRTPGLDLLTTEAKLTVEGIIESVDHMGRLSLSLSAARILEISGIPGANIGI